MSDLQAHKTTALAYFDTLERIEPADLAKALSQHTAPGYRFRGVHPFNERDGVHATVEAVWQPMRHALAGLQRRQDIFMAGRNLIDETIWVTSMGKFMGLFDHDWLGIPATGKIALLPYCEFCRVQGTTIIESALWVDLISLMKQAGLRPLPMQTGAEIINPGPRTGDGLMFGPQDAGESQKTLDLIMAMCNDLVGDGMESSSDILRRTWHEDMLWFGPSGIGATYTVERYQRQHQHPFSVGLENLVFNGHVLEHAEGNYGAWFGWPNLSMQQGEGFMGLPASERPTEMRVVDVYRRDGDKLAENWIFIDVLHYLKLIGIDVLARCESLRPHAQTPLVRVR